MAWHESHQDGVVRRLDSRDGWSRRWAQAMAGPALAAPRLAGPRLVSDPLPAWPAGPGGKDEGDFQAGGRNAGLVLLDTFLHRRGEDYARGMSSPLSAGQACSRLSPHLAWGTLSPREAHLALTRRQAEVAMDPALAGWRRPLAAFEARLAWRGHFMQKLESAPALEWENLHPALADARQSVDPTLFEPWCQGRTGLPLVDACMRSLAATGWLNFRMRAMLAAFACYHLWQPWRHAGLHLARLFTDYEPGIHWSQMQMQSGSTGINAFRIYNPVKQSLDQDPQGRFIRRWVPELAEVPAEWFHTPWRMSPDLQSRCGCHIGRDYPAPIVDHELAAREARARLHQAYRGEAARAASQRVMQQLGIRKRRPLASSAASRKKAAPDPQASLFD
jgi:deoxyribodipyrimidine photo-lyase